MAPWVGVDSPRLTANFFGRECPAQVGGRVAVAGTQAGSDCVAEHLGRARADAVRGFVRAVVLRAANDGQQFGGGYGVCREVVRTPVRTPRCWGLQAMTWDNAERAAV